MNTLFTLCMNFITSNVDKNTLQLLSDLPEEIFERLKTHMHQTLTKEQQIELFKCYEEWYGSRLYSRTIYTNGHQNEKVIVWPYDGSIVQYHCKYGKYHGWHRKWQNGQLVMKIKYMGGKKIGRCKWWHNNGKLNVRCSYRQGKRHGLYERWDKFGFIVKRCTYQDGIKDGLYASWKGISHTDRFCIYKQGKIDYSCPTFNKNIRSHKRKLHDAVILNDIAKVDYMCSKGMELFAKLAYTAAKKNNVTLLKWLLDNGCPFNKKQCISNGRWYFNSEMKNFLATLPHGFFQFTSLPKKTFFSNEFNFITNEKCIQ